jgi:hypothetical protein
MQEKSILFSTDMVRAIIDEKKSQTRRVYKNEKSCPFGVKGDFLYVREKWRLTDDGNCIIYYADNEKYPEIYMPKWKPAIHMPKKYSRIKLEITNVRVERLQGISTADIRAEGLWFAENDRTIDTRDEFKITWDQLYEERGYGWRTNPMVWVIDFKLIAINRRRILSDLINGWIHLEWKLG